MTKRFVLSAAALLACLGAACAQDKDTASQQHSAIGVADAKSQAEVVSNARTRWFTDAGLGLFITWGISSVDGGHDLSWGMMNNCPWNNPDSKMLTPEDYWALADRFNPQDYHPEQWLQAAKDAGFGYAVLVLKHHDGYALWPSKFGDFSTRTKLGGRDLVRDYVEACRKVGLRVGLYYSPPDWYINRRYMSFGYGTKGTPESPNLGLRHEPVELPVRPAGFEDEYVAYINGQLTELLTNYGKIDLLWFDGSAGPKVLSQEAIRKLQPDILINDRQHGAGDFTTAHYECKLPAERPKGVWEHCYGLTSCWGYQTSNEGSDPQSLARYVLVPLVRCRAWGGNILPNCGPRPTGNMPEPYYGCMKIVQQWMATRRESVIGVTAGPYPEQSNVPVTVRDKTWYLHLLPDSKDDPVLTGVQKPTRVTMLGADKPLDFQFEGDKVTIRVPAELRTKLVDVIKVEW